jgi:hypothetical protein
LFLRRCLIRRKKDKRKAAPGLQTSISPASTDAEEASADARDDEALSDYERREADSDSNTDTLAQLRAKIAMLESRVQTSHLESRGAPASRLTIWKHHSLRPIPADTPTMDKPASLLLLRRGLFDWLGAHSFVLRLSDQERKLLDTTDLVLLRANRKAFIETWAPGSITNLQHDVYSELKKHLRGSILVTHLFSQVTSEHPDCGTRLWDAMITAFHPHSHQVVSAMVAEAASTILRGPDQNISDPVKAFRKWDAAVSSLNQSAQDLPPLDAQMLSTCLMVASLHASPEDSYFQAYLHLQSTLAQPSATLDANIVRTAAVNAFTAEQRKRASDPPAPDSVLGFAAAASGPRRPFTGTSTPAPSCCRCPHHCVLPDGTFRIVRPPVEAHLAAVPDRGPEADVSDKTLRAYRVYKATVASHASSSADIERANEALQQQRQDDRERARYYRMQEEEEALLAIAAARDDYDSDD